MVYSRPELPVPIDAIGTQADVNNWPHLKGLTIPSIEAQIDLLIGSDVPQAMLPREVRQSKNGGPFAARTALGWMFKWTVRPRTENHNCKFYRYRYKT